MKILSQISEFLQLKSPLGSHCLITRISPPTYEDRRIIYRIRNKEKILIKKKNVTQSKNESGKEEIIDFLLTYLTTRC